MTLLIRSAKHSNIKKVVFQIATHRKVIIINAKLMAQLTKALKFQSQKCDLSIYPPTQQMRFFFGFTKKRNINNQSVEKVYSIVSTILPLLYLPNFGTLGKFLCLIQRNINNGKELYQLILLFKVDHEPVVLLPWVSADFFPGGGGQENTFCLKTYYFPQKSPKSYDFWLPRPTGGWGGGKSPLCPPPDAHAYNVMDH